MTSSTPSPEIIAENTWALDTMIDEGGRFLSRPVVPQWRTVRVGEDGAIRVTLIAAEPFVGFPSEHLAAPGTVLAETEDEDGAEEWALTYPLPIPADPAGIGAYLAQCHGGASPSVGDYFVEVRNLLSVRLLSAVQEAAILRFLAELPGLRIDGSITDRLGRTGIVFRATDRMPGRYEDLLIVSPASGKILAAEKVYVGAERTDIPSPAVVDYVAWA